jgi:hypothetical protein
MLSQDHERHPSKSIRVDWTHTQPFMPLLKPAHPACPTVALAKADESCHNLHPSFLTHPPGEMQGRGATKSAKEDGTDSA